MFKGDYMIRLMVGTILLFVAKVLLEWLIRAPIHYGTRRRLLEVKNEEEYATEREVEVI